MAAVFDMWTTAALPYGEANIRVNAICPGYIPTPLTTNAVGKPDELVAERSTHYPERQPIPRSGTPDDIAQMAMFLASDRSTFVTGQAIVVDGGAASGVMWADQSPGYKQYRPIKVYNPDDV